jgi:hypothetical protein
MSECKLMQPNSSTLTKFSFAMFMVLLFEGRWCMVYSLECCSTANALAFGFAVDVKSSAIHEGSQAEVILALQSGFSGLICQTPINSEASN